MAKVSVIGAGSWGTALALLLSKNGHDVTMWSILEDEIRMLDKERAQIKASGREASGYNEIYNRS